MTDAELIALMNDHERGEHRNGTVSDCVLCENDRLRAIAFAPERLRQARVHL